MFNLLFSINGRSGRGAWWLAQFIAIPAVYLLGIGILAGTMSMDADPAHPTAATGGVVLLVVAIALIVGIWINVASTVKRFHDRNKSGAWFFILFVPFIGGLWQIIECGFCSGDSGDNDYGPPAGSGRSAGRIDPAPSGMAEAASGRLAKLDDDYFRNYAAQQRQQQRMGEPLVQSTYARPSATVSAAPGFGARPTFGRR